MTQGFGKRPATTVGKSGSQKARLGYEGQSGNIGKGEGSKNNGTKAAGTSRAIANRKKKEAETRAKTALHHDAPDAQKEAAPLDHLGHRSRHHYCKAYKYSERFYLDLVDLNQLDTVPDATNSAQAFFDRQLPDTFDFGATYAFVTFRLINFTGSTMGELPTIGFLPEFFSAFAILYYRMTETRVDTVISQKIRAAIRHDLPKRFQIRDLERIMYYLDAQVLRTIATMAMSPYYNTNYTYTRIQVLLMMAILDQNNVRVGSICPNAAYRGLASALLWKDCEIGIRRDEAGGNNRITVAFRTKQSKTATGNDLLIVLETTDGAWFDPVLFLILAFFKGAFPKNTTFKQLLDPRYFIERPELGSYVKLSFDPLKGEEPVFCQSKYPDVAWSNGDVRDQLRTLSELSPIGLILVPHALKRMGQQHAKDCGQSNSFV